MSGSQSQIVCAYEVAGMSPEDIAADMEGYDLASIKAALMNGSSKYRRDCNAETIDDDQLNFSNDDLQAVNDVILNTAKYAEDEHLRFKAATYVRDDKKGRKEVIRQVANQTFNLLNFNASLEQARAMKAKLLSGSNGVVSV